MKLARLQVALRKVLRLAKEPRTWVRVACLWAALLVLILLWGALQRPGVDIVIYGRISLGEGADTIATLPRAKLYVDYGEGMLEEDATSKVFRPSMNRSELRFSLPPGIQPKLRFDPFERGPGQLEIYDLWLEDRLTGEVLTKLKQSRVRSDMEMDVLPGVTLLSSNEVDPQVRISLTKELPQAREDARSFLGYIPRAAGTALVAALLLFFGLAFAGAINLPRLVQRFFSSITSRLGPLRLSPLPLRSRLDQALFALFLVLVVALGWNINTYGESLRVMENPFEPQFADPSAPVSDALYIWMRGAMYYYMDDVPSVNVYRPILGLFHASYLKLHFDIAWVPPAIFWSVMILVGVCFVQCGTYGRLFFICAVAAAVLPFHDTFSYIAPHVFGPGVLVYGMGVFGIFLVMGAIMRRDRIHEIGALLGMIMVSIAGTVRGPQLLGAVLLLGILMLSRFPWKGRHPIIFCVLAVVCFLIPWSADSQIRKAYDIDHNGWAALHSAVESPEHRWDSVTYTEVFMKERPDQPEAREAYYKQIMKDFVAFRFSVEGVKDLFSKAWERSYLDGRGLQKPIYIWLGCGFITLWVITWLWGRLEDTGQRWRNYSRLIFVTAHALLPLLLIYLELNHWATVGWVVLLYTALILPLLALRWRLWLTFGVLAFGIGSLFLHCAVGLTGSNRAAGTYNFYIFLSWFLVPLELYLRSLATPKPEPQSLSGSKSKEKDKVPPSTSKPEIALVNPWSVGILAGWLFFLFFGNFLMRPDAKRVFQEFYMPEDNRSIAIKIANKPSLDRSLYMEPIRSLCFYTPYDGLQPGFLKKLPEGFEKPERHGEHSLTDPITIFSDSPEPETGSEP